MLGRLCLAISVGKHGGQNNAMKTLAKPVLDRLLDPLAQMLTPEVAQKLVRYRFDATAQAQLNKLARKCNESKLTEQERCEYESYVQVSDVIAILQAKARHFSRTPRPVDGPILAATASSPCKGAM